MDKYKKFSCENCGSSEKPIRDGEFYICKSCQTAHFINDPPILDVLRNDRGEIVREDVEMEIAKDFSAGFEQYKRIIFNGAAYDVSKLSPRHIVQKIEELARENNCERFEVYDSAGERKERPEILEGKFLGNLTIARYHNSDHGIKRLTKVELKNTMQCRHQRLIPDKNIIIQRKTFLGISRTAHAMIVVLGLSFFGFIYSTISQQEKEKEKIRIEQRDNEKRMIEHQMMIQQKLRSLDSTLIVSDKFYEPASIELYKKRHELK